MRKFVAVIDDSVLKYFNYHYNSTFRISRLLPGTSNFPIAKFPSGKPEPDDICVVVFTIEDRWYKKHMHLFSNRRVNKPNPIFGKKMVLSIFRLPGQALRKSKFRLFIQEFRPEKKVEILATQQLISGSILYLCLDKGE